MAQRAGTSRFATLFAASGKRSTLFILFVPSKTRENDAVDQPYWVDEALRVLGDLLGGATAYPKARGVWKDMAQDGTLLFDEPVIIQSYTSQAALRKHAAALRKFLHRMGREAEQGAIGFVIDRDYFEIESYDED